MNGSSAWFAPAIDALLAARGGTQVGRLGFTVFNGHRAQVLIACDELGPLGVIRRWRARGGGDHELGMLEELVSSEPPHVIRTLPRHVISASRGGADFSAQSWLSGAPLRSSTRDRSPAALERTLQTVADWFEARIRPRVPTGAFPNFVGDVLLRRLTRRIPGGAAERALSAFTEQSFGLEAECGVLHNDLHPGNLLFDESGGLSGVIDWEHAGPGPLLCDWFGFVAELALWRSGERGGVEAASRALQRAWDDGAALCRIARAPTRRLVELSRATPAALDACFRLAAFRFSYARSQDESEAAQVVVARSLNRALPGL